MPEEPRSLLAKMVMSMHRPGEFDAMFRGALKDIQNTFHQAAFGHPAPAAEMGEPLSPTPQIVTAQLIGKPLTLGQSNEGALDMPEQTTLAKLTGYANFAKERADAALERMDNAKKQPEQHKEQERGGIAM